MFLRRFCWKKYLFCNKLLFLSLSKVKLSLDETLKVSTISAYIYIWNARKNVRHGEQVTLKMRKYYMYVYKKKLQCWISELWFWSVIVILSVGFWIKREFRAELKPKLHFHEEFMQNGIKPENGGRKRSWRIAVKKSERLKRR